MTDRLRRAMAAWRRALGDAHALDDEATLARYARATFDAPGRPVAVLRPASRDEVREALLVAAREGVAVHPISRGRNWGLGSRTPPRDAAVLELARMDAITDFDEGLGRVTVEPGVTFRQLHAFLAARGARVFASVTGSSPEASVLGNALERGDGSGPYGDRWAHLCDLEVVLSTGEVLRTGFSRFDGARAAGAHRWGVGPSLDGLFSQSNLGVVTRATVWLHPLPRSLQAMRFSLRDPSRLAPLVDALRGLRMEGTLRAPVSLWSALRVLSAEAHAPAPAPLSDDVVDALRPGWEGARWMGLAGLYAATEDMGRAARERVVERLAPCVDAWGCEELSGDPVAGRELLWPGEPAFGALQGVAHERSLRSAYWRRPAAPEADLDPDRDGCGVLWVCAAVPWRGDDLARATTLAGEAMRAQGFDPMLAAVAPGERAMYLYATLFWDRDDPHADARATRAHDAVLAALAAEGYLPYRLGTRSQGALPAASDDSAAVLARLRAALDPAGVVSPGRYEP